MIKKRNKSTRTNWKSLYIKAYNALAEEMGKTSRLERRLESFVDKVVNPPLVAHSNNTPHETLTCSDGKWDGAPIALQPTGVSYWRRLGLAVIGRYPV